MNRIVRVEHGHTDLSEDEYAYHEWVTLGDTEWRTKDGKKRRGSWRWQKVRCNNVDCAAVAWVSQAAIEEYVTSLLPPLPGVEEEE